MNIQTKDKGFTIIEVVLVLAIAALIFLMIFVALPALQRGQRDTARKSEAGAIASAITTYRSNNNGGLPSDAAKFKSQYVNNLNEITTIDITDVQDPTPKEGEAIIVKQAKCDKADGGGTESVTSTKQAAVVVFVENGGKFCQDA